MNIIQLSDSQVDDIKHALGLNRQKRPYRNHYNDNDNRSWNILCDLDYADKYPVKQCAGNFMYCISNQGIYYIQQNPETFNLDKRYTKMSVEKFREKFDI